MASNSGDGGVRLRASGTTVTELGTETTYSPGQHPTDYDPDLPYGGKVYLARKKKPDPLWVTVLEVSKNIVCL